MIPSGKVKTRVTLLKARRAVVPFYLEINFSSKVYSKSLLKVGSL